MKSIFAAKQLAESLLDQHELTEWKIVFIDARSKFGHCAYDKKEIAISRQHARDNSKARVRGTVLHEIAHALVGPNVKSHGAEWQAQARCLGLTGERMQTANAIRLSRRRKYLARYK